MKFIDKRKAQKLINKIESGDFDYNVVDSLFMILRAYSNDNFIFREFSDFVAHNDERDRGVVKSSIEYMYLSTKFAQEYSFQNKNLDVTDSFPSWIKILMIYQIDEADNEELKNNYGFNKNQLKKLVKRIFKVSADGQMVQLHDDQMSIKKYLVIRFLLSFINVRSSFTQNEIIKDVIDVVKKNDLTINEINFLENKNLFILNLIILLHYTKYKCVNNQTGYSIIHCVEGDENASKLIQISGVFKIDEEITIVFKILSTELSASDYIDKSILNQDEFYASNSIYLPINIDISDSNMIVLI